jgi:hypothetical protein
VNPGVTTPSTGSASRHLGAVAQCLLMALCLLVVAAAVIGGRSQRAEGSVTGFQHIVQGTVPQFVVRCAYSHSATDDPIVFPGDPGASHRHDFFGNRSTDAFSTPDAMLDADTSCQQALDTAAYWAPTLFDHGVPVVPQGADVYYRPGPHIDPTSVQPYPHGLVMISGDAMAMEPQSTDFVGWACGSGGDPQVEAPICPPDAPLRLKVVFPDCWNGRDLDSADHRSHMAASVDGRCPSEHPVPVPQLQLTVRYPIHGDGHELNLAPGSMLGGHADFMNAWDQRELASQVTLCLNRALVCGVISNKAEDVDRPLPSRS